MADPTAADIANAIADRLILNEWWFYALWALGTVVASAIGFWLKETVKGDITKDIWFTQESWKEKYRIYTVLIDETEEIAAALWNIVTDTRVLVQMPMAQHSSIDDGLRLFPEHRQFLDSEERAIAKIAALSVGAELMLNAKAKEALEKISRSRTRSTLVLNMSYRQRIEERQTAASEAKVMLIEAAKADLKI